MIDLLPTVVFRIPRFSYIQTLERNWNELKECIKVSSPDFYDVICQMTYEQLLQSDRKIQVTVNKYHNRATLRSTPYGLFASVGVAHFSWNNDCCVQVESKPVIHSFEDWQSKNLVLPSFEELKGSEILLFCNSTYYVIADQIRYLRSIEGNYHLAVVEKDDTILAILDGCNLPKTPLQLQQHLPDIDEDILLQYLTDLLEVGILLSSKHPNVIGADYFARIGHAMDQKTKKYIIPESKVLIGAVNQKAFKHLPELAVLMHRILEDEQSEDLKQFRERFIRKFDQQEIRLMVAIDPEAGVGYGGLETPFMDDRLQVLFQDSKKVNSNPKQHFLRDKLFREVILKSYGNSNIDLESIELQIENSSEIPDTLSALCTLIDDELFLDSLGGATGTTLPARFALGVEEIKKHCSEIAAFEQAANPDFILFDIGYTKEEDVDNINRRPSIYGHQLNILNFDTSDEPLLFKDILVSIRNGVVMLRSQKHGKFLLPRFASAYNYTRSDLAVFRLLMDLQSQGHHTSLSFKLRGLMPKLPYYPRVQFRNIVVSPATWFVESSVLIGVKKWKEKCKKLAEYLQATVPCKLVKVGSADQMLSLNIFLEEHIEIILALLEKHGNLYLEEAYLPKTTIISDEAGNPFLPQILVTLTNKGNIKKQPEPTPKAKASLQEQRQWVAPGSDWLYFEIYCNPFSFDSILQQRVILYIKANKRFIKYWFFIRYNENGDHIRLRLRLKDREHGYILIAALSETLKNELHLGIVSDIRICTYKKEIHRYSEKLIQSVEDHFHVDSWLVLGLISNQFSDFDKYRLCISSIEMVLENRIIHYQDLTAALSLVTEALKKEHHITQPGLKAINGMFKEFLKEDSRFLNRQLEKRYQKFKISLIYVLSQCPENSRPHLFVDLMHMHINRLYSSRQRTHELIVYEFYFSLSKRRQHVA